MRPNIKKCLLPDKVLKLACTATCLFVFLGLTYAQPPQDSSKGVNLEVGIDAHHFNYLEPGAMQMQGPGAGVWLGLSERKGQWTGKLELSVGQSKLHYDSLGTGELSGIADQLTQWRLLMERHFDANAGGWSPSVYAGWAKRNNNNNFQGTTTTGAQAYRRSNERSYLPLGITLNRPAGAADSGDEWSVSAEWRRVLKGQHTTRLTDVGATEDNTSKQTGRGWGLQAQRNWGPWRLTVYTNQWDMNATDPWKSNIDGVTYTFKEPANETRETGLRITRLF